MAPETNREAIVGAVGTAVLVAAMVGLFFYERAQFEAYEVSWTQREADDGTRSGTLEAGASESYTFTASEQRLAGVSAALTWSDDAGAPDTFELAIQGPNGTYQQTAEGDASPLEIEIPVKETPETTKMTARSLEGARQQVNASASWTNGTGEWSMTVTLVSAPGDQIAGQEAMEDGSQSYELTFAYDRWVAALMPA